MTRPARAINLPNIRFLFEQEVKPSGKHNHFDTGSNHLKGSLPILQFSARMKPGLSAAKMQFPPATALARNNATFHFSNYPGNYSEAPHLRRGSVRPHAHNSQTDQSGFHLDTDPMGRTAAGHAQHADIPSGTGNSPAPAGNRELRTHRPFSRLS